MNSKNTFFPLIFRFKVKSNKRRTVRFKQAKNDHNEIRRHFEEASSFLKIRVCIIYNKKNSRSPKNVVYRDGGIDQNSQKKNVTQNQEMFEIVRGDYRVLRKKKFPTQVNFS
jgi:hypothetical protein